MVQTRGAICFEWLLYLDYVDRSRCLRVSRNWLSDGSKARFWRVFDARKLFKSYGAEKGKRRLKELLDEAKEKDSRWSELETINFECCKQVFDKDIEAIIRTQHLKYINLNAAHGISSLAIEKLLTRCPNLERIELFWHPRLTDSVLQALAKSESSQNLVWLNLSGCQSLTDTGLEHILRACPRIHHIDITRCPKLTDTTLRLLAETNGNHLQALIAYADSNFTDAGFGSLANARLSSLEALDCCGARHLTSAGLSALVRRAGPTLRTLNLSWCVSVDDEGGLAIAQHCVCLELLSFHGNRFISDITINALAASPAASHSLTTLDLSGCFKVSDYRRNTNRLQSLFPLVSCWTVHR